MVIRSEKELILFEAAIDRCKRTVFLVTSCGKQYDLKNLKERHLGIAALLTAIKNEEPELFTCCYDDEKEMFDFLAAQESFVCSA